VKVGALESVVGGRDDRERFDRACRAGCAGVEVILLREQLRRGDRPATLRAARAATGLEIPTLVLDEHNLGGISSPSRDVAAAACEDARTAIAWAAELGAGVILVPFFVEAELLDDAAFERAVNAFRELCPLAESHRVVLAYEGTLPARRVRALAERIASPAFACYFDLANLLVRGLDPATEIRGLEGLICRVHVKDLLARKNDARPGLGRVDFADCRAALEELGYDGWLCLETPPAPVPVVARDVAFTQAVFGIEHQGAPVYGAFSGSCAEWDELVDAFGSAGLGAVQLDGPLLERCLADGAFAAAGRSTLETAGLVPAAIAGYANLVASDAAARCANLERVRQCLELAPVLGTSVVATGAGTRSADGLWTDHPDNWRRETSGLLDDAVAELVATAAANDVVLALEGTHLTALRTLSQLLDLLERHPSPNLQLVCDPYNFVSYDLLPVRERVTAEYLERFESRFVLAHLKDVGVDGVQTTRPEFGTGIFDQRPYLDFLRMRRPDLPLVFEHLPFEHLVGAVARAAAYA
jgi:sugar phosphate isomerase/epimerase